MRGRAVIASAAGTLSIWLALPLQAAADPSTAILRAFETCRALTEDPLWEMPKEWVEIGGDVLEGSPRPGEVIQRGQRELASTETRLVMIVQSGTKISPEPVMRLAYTCTVFAPLANFQIDCATCSEDMLNRLAKAEDIPLKLKQKQVNEILNRLEHDPTFVAAGRSGTVPGLDGYRFVECKDDPLTVIDIIPQSEFDYGTFRLDVTAIFGSKSGPSDLRQALTLCPPS